MIKIKEHTLQKLEYFKKYLNAYLMATKRLSQRYYIDAFAGSGKCIVTGTKKKVDGSSLIALKAKISFDRYILIEKKKSVFKELESFIKKEISTNRLNLIDLHNDDCNKLLKNYPHNPSLYVGYLIFLDPAGSELFWETIISLSKIKKADLLILYPYDMSLARLIKDYPKKLDRFYGTNKWSNIYKNAARPIDAKKDLLDFYKNNLEKLGFKFVIYRQVRKKFREGKPLYHLLLATHSPIGKKIMSDIFDKELDHQQKLKL